MSAYRRHQRVQSLDTAFHTIARFDCADTRGRAGEDQVAGRKFEQRRQLCDDFRHAPDQVGDVALLPQFAVDLEPDPALVEVAAWRGLDAL